MMFHVRITSAFFITVTQISCFTTSFTVLNLLSLSLITLVLQMSVCMYLYVCMYICIYVFCYNFYLDSA